MYHIVYSFFYNTCYALYGNLVKEKHNNTGGILLEFKGDIAWFTSDTIMGTEGSLHFRRICVQNWFGTFRQYLGSAV